MGEQKHLQRSQPLSDFGVVKAWHALAPHGSANHMTRVRVGVWVEGKESYQCKDHLTQNKSRQRGRGIVFGKKRKTLICPHKRKQMKSESQKEIRSCIFLNSYGQKSKEMKGNQREHCCSVRTSIYINSRMPVNYPLGQRFSEECWYCFKKDGWVKKKKNWSAQSVITKDGQTIGKNRER